MTTRRDFTKLALAALPGTTFLRAANAKPNSKYAGVQIGINAPYSFGSPTMSADETLKNILELGLSGVELRTQPVEMALGLDKSLIEKPKKGDKVDTKGNAEKLREWRKSVSMDKVNEFRAKWEAAGVLIEVVKVDNLFKLSDDELDYAFTLVKTLGGRAMSSEISHEESELKRVGAFADKHQLLVGYHGHATTKPGHWEAAFAVAKYNGANVDLGHFVAGNNTSPVPFLKKYHDRVTHVHLKDRKFNNGPNTPFGEGDTPLVEVLRLMRDEKWTFQGTIEFEYKVPEGSDRMKEIARAIKFCRDALA
jgi:sugar phosphate isomerase/epimerase